MPKPVEAPVEARATAGQEGPSEPLKAPVDYVPAKPGDVLELEMGDGFIVYNHEADLVHSLNPSAAVVWQLCDGDGTVAELATEIAGAYGVDARELEVQLAQLIAEFDALGLVIDNRLEA